MIPENVNPLLVFVNVKSGGCQGLNLITSFRKLLNPHQVFNLENGGPLPGYVYYHVAMIAQGKSLFVYFSTKTFRPIHDDKVLLIIENAHAEVSNGARGLHFGLRVVKARTSLCICTDTAH